jgi:hypothetical protein
VRFFQRHRTGVIIGWAIAVMLAIMSLAARPPAVWHAHARHAPSARQSAPTIGVRTERHTPAVELDLLVTRTTAELRD